MLLKSYSQGSYCNWHTISDLDSNNHDFTCSLEDLVSFASTPESDNVARHQ